MADKHWENPEVTGYGRLPARASFEHLPHAGATAGERLSLHGVWQFQRVAHPDAAPAGWTQDFGGHGSGEPVGADGWQHTVVPGLWTRDADLKVPDRPIYTNVLMPFRAEPPRVPETNPTGLYRRVIDVPADWVEDRVTLYVGGVENCYYLYCNGVEVGFAKDCRLPSEFDLGPYLQAGRNLVCLKVMRWSDASYIEDQDQWWHAGIHRDIYLYRTRSVYLRDVHCRPVYDVATREGELTVDVRVGGENRTMLGATVSARLLDAQGAPMAVSLGEGSVAREQFAPVTGKGPRIALHARVGEVAAWSAEAPVLYQVEVTLRDAEGRELGATRVRIGFRHVEIRNRELLINGQAVLIKGVNRHDHSDTTGKVISEDLMRLDIETMKRHNINAVRTSHYPNDARFYQLCDEYGLYVFDECNIEAHHHYQQLGADPAWASAFLERVVRMVERDKNHPSIIAWSMGNETGFGPHHAAMAAWVREYDPSRVIHNEPAICEQAVRDMWEDNHHGTDLVCPMYPTVDEIVRFAAESRDPRPLIMCEFAHAMGNSCGNLKEYWQAVENHHGLQGGFIWEWLDHGLAETANGVPYWAYGGDFGEDRHDLNFVCDGLCWPDRTPHSSLLEYKTLLQPVAVKHLGGDRFRVTNKQWFTDLSGYAGSFELLLNGEVARAGQLPVLAIAPQQAEEIVLDLSRPTLRAGDELSIVFHFSLAQAASWAPAGHVVALEQCSLGRRRASAKVRTRKVHARIGAQSCELADRAARLVFDGEGLQSWQPGAPDADATTAQEVLHRGPELNVWRAPLDNDGIKGWTGQDDKPLGRWRALGLESLQRRSHEWTAGVGGAVPEITYTSEYAAQKGSIGLTLCYRVPRSDTVEVRAMFEVSDELADLPRLGLRMALQPGFEELAWFGRGPHETYVDRRSAGTVRVHHSTVMDQYVPYILPQEHGNLTDVRWLRVSDGARQLQILGRGELALEASASHYPHELLTPAFHTYELSPTPQTWLSVDVMQRGVGGASCGPDTLPEYRLGAGRHELAFTLSLT